MNNYESKKYLLHRFFYVLKNEGIFNVLKKVIKTIFDSNKIDLDLLYVEKNLSLDDLFIKFGTDKGSLDGKKTYDFLEKNKKGGKFKNYYEWINRDNPKSFNYQFGLNFTPFYEKYFNHLRNKSIKILELGVANGHSVASWLYYFPNAMIYAVDIKKSDKFFYKSKRIQYHSVDLLNEKSVQKFIKKNNNFDIIIEDSLHTQEGTTKILKNFYPTLNPGGVYAIEDFNHIDIIIDKTKKFNEASGKSLMVKFPLTLHEIFQFISQKKMFKHAILKEENIKYIFDTNNRTEVHYGEHPWSSIAFLIKNS